MRDVDVVQRDPKKRGRDLPHEASRQIDREFVRTLQRACMGGEIDDRELEHSFYCVEARRIKLRVRCFKGGLIVVL